MRHHHHRARRSRIRHGFPRLLTHLSLSPGGGGIIAAGTPPARRPSAGPAAGTPRLTPAPPDGRHYRESGFKTCGADRPALPAACRTPKNRLRRPPAPPERGTPANSSAARTAGAGREQPPYPGANDLRRTSNRSVRACGRQPTKTTTADTAGPLRGAYDSLQSL